MQSNVSFEIVSALLEKKQFGLLADLILKSLHARRSSRDEDASDGFVVSQILMTVARHLRFIEAFGESGKPHEDADGTYHNRFDDYFNVWIGLGAFGINSELLNESRTGKSKSDTREIP